MAVSIPEMSPPAAEDLGALADWVGRSLPASYVDFVRRHDGATLPDNSIKTLDNELTVVRFIPVCEATSMATNVEGFPVAVIPLAEDDCGNHFYIEPSTGAVHFWDHELDGLDELVAEDVDAFVEKLMPFDARAVALDPGQVKRVWVNPSFKPEF
ncbi:SMI1/KNR4 family protein [Altererythrobacter fulvus]|uniref:SMI1/KNR4 family protein n=1 Tax=Caenibius fulvus TaxID=2126012 RepID=UPI003018E019